eukprot:TRINITY_DN61293_c0_g1_i1.p1 TRINITY_DN61293_c0_g1~~TRINITY_DN61293_c0_g1_i1.p1  ORF type:complete len:413 (-),score=42.50 TRINITY_DN61293_c0_g1_i1:8-1246(-)
MVLEEKITREFTFKDFAEHFPDGAEEDAPLLQSEDVECACGKLRLHMCRESGKFAMRLYRSDSGVLPMRINCKLSVTGSAEYELKVTFLPKWCSKPWDIDTKLLNGALLTFTWWGWPDSPLALSVLKQAAAADGVLKVQAKIVAYCPSSVLAGHESCLRGNMPGLIAGMAGSTSVKFQGPNGLCVELPKALLCAHSSVLQAALTSTMVEGQSQIIKVDDLQDQALKDAVCLCSGGLPSAVVTTWQGLFDLLVVADKYAVQSLADACISLLSTAVSEKTVAPLIKSADEAGLTKLVRCLLYSCLSSPSRMNAVIDSDEYTIMSADLLRCFAAHQEVVGSDRFLEYPESLQHLDVQYEFDDTTDWSNLSSFKLRRACFERDLATSGTPKDLRKRLSTPRSSVHGEPETKRQRRE